MVCDQRCRLRCLLIEDRKMDRWVLEKELVDLGVELIPVESAEDAIKKITEGVEQIDLFVIDAHYSYDDIEWAGIYALEKIAASIYRDRPVVLVTVFPDAPEVQAAVKQYEPIFYVKRMGSEVEMRHRLQEGVAEAMEARSRRGACCNGSGTAS